MLFEPKEIKKKLNGNGERKKKKRQRKSNLVHYFIITHVYLPFYSLLVMP